MPRSQALSFAVRNRASPLHKNNSTPLVLKQFRYTPFFRHSHTPYRDSLFTCRRSFTQHASLLSLYRNAISSRPQLPFLHPASRTSSNLNSRSFLTRYLSTERKQRWRQTLRWQLRFHAYFWPALVLLGLMMTGLKQAELERKYPTPRSWSFWMRWHLRSALYEDEVCRRRGGGLMRQGWVSAGRYYAQVLKACEIELAMKNMGNDSDQNAEEERLLVDGVGEISGSDLSQMSEEWKMGYFQAVMGCAKCAEHLEGMAKMRNEEYGRVVPWESVIGPSNLRPKPLPWDKKGSYKDPPREADVEDAYAKPEIYYMRVLTTRAFTDRQRLDAAIAYADYLDYKGLHETARDMYDWALDIAAGGLPLGADGVVDMQTGVIGQGKDGFVSENMLRATTAMGVHYAKTGDVKSALPIFVSVLRARKSLEPMPIELQKKTSKQEDGDSLVWKYLQAVKNFIIEAPYPLSTSTGNERPYHSLKEACEEVGLMTYIGEILFASGQKEREKGLSWTRDSVGAAEAVLWVMDEQRISEGEQQCRECLEAGLDNWKKMTREMTKTAKERAGMIEQNNGLLGLGIGKARALQSAKEEVARWEEEESHIQLRQLKTASLLHPVQPSGSSVYRV